MNVITMHENGLVEPFGLYIIRDSEHPFMADMEEYSEEIPGVDGEIYFGARFKATPFKLQCINRGFLSSAEKETLKISVSGQLYQLKEYDLLVCDWMPDKAWRIRLAGKPELPDIPGRVKLTIPLVYQPFRISVDERYIVSEESFIQYKGVEMAETLGPDQTDAVIVNHGTVATPFKIEVVGPVTNPSVNVGGHVFTYAGTLTASDTLILDTGKLTATYNGVNALAHVEGMSMVKLAPEAGTTITAAASGTTTFKWHELWA